MRWTHLLYSFSWKKRAVQKSFMAGNIEKAVQDSKSSSKQQSDTGRVRDISQPGHMYDSRLKARAQDSVKQPFLWGSTTHIRQFCFNISAHRWYRWRSHGMASHRNAKLGWGCRIWAFLSGIATRKDVLFNWFADIIPTPVNSWFEEIFIPRCEVLPECRQICFTLHIRLVALPPVLRVPIRLGSSSCHVNVWMFAMVLFSPPGSLWQARGIARDGKCKRSRS